MRKTADGSVAKEWCGQRPMVLEMCFFTGYGTEACCPDGGLLIKVPGGSIRVNVGQWVVKKPNGTITVVDNSDIVLAD